MVQRCQRQGPVVLLRRELMRQKKKIEKDFFEFKGAAGMSLEADNAGGGSNGVVAILGWAQGQ